MNHPPGLHRVGLLVPLFFLYCSTLSNAIRINCGGPSIGSEIKRDSKEYYGKTSTYVGSYNYNSGNYRDNVYHSHAYAINRKNLIYTIPAPAGWTVSVTAQFAEIYAGTGKEGARVFDVLFNDKVAAWRLDVYKKTKKLGKPYDVTKTITVPKSGQIEIKIVPVVENAMISGITVLEKVGEEPTKEEEDTISGKPGQADAEEEIKPETKPEPEKTKPKVGPVIGSGSWRTVDTRGTEPARRHENCAVMCGGKMYLIGGRGFRAVSVYDPKTRKWTNKKVTPKEMNHMQCVSWKERYIYVVGAWYGPYPREKLHENTWVYDTYNDSWETEPGLPAERRRSSSSLALHEGKLYLAMGNQGGHGVGSRTYGYLDVYDLNDKQKGWRPLADAPDRRDHAHGGIVPGGYFCVGGGRNGGSANFWGEPILPVNCYKIATGKWERRAEIPDGRGGAATVTTCQGYLMIAGGEGRDIGTHHGGKAYDRVDFYDVRTDTFLKPTKLAKSRHGTGVAISNCECGNIYIASGSPNLGGGNPDLSTTEAWNLDGDVKDC